MSVRSVYIEILLNQPAVTTSPDLSRDGSAVSPHPGAAKSLSPNLSGDFLTLTFPLRSLEDSSLLRVLMEKVLEYSMMEIVVVVIVNLMVENSLLSDTHY